jgi:acetylornithine deacetylase/succinyl-diaminopimelate desuccinylase-like protein
LRGDGSKKPLLIAAHEDVVGVEREKWSLDPFAGVIKDGYVYGRGAIDFKGGLAVFAQAVLDIARQKRPLARDIIFVAEADEGMTRAPVSPDQQKAMDARTRMLRRVTESPKGALYEALVKQAKLSYPGARVTPYLFQAGTDAYAWRSRGVPVYGIYPYPIRAQDLERMHGNDERVPVASLESGLKMITNTLLEVAR